MRHFNKIQSSTLERFMLVFVIRAKFNSNRRKTCDKNYTLNKSQHNLCAFVRKKERFTIVTSINFMILYWGVIGLPRCKKSEKTLIVIILIKNLRFNYIVYGCEYTFNLSICIVAAKLRYQLMHSVNCRKKNRNNKLCRRNFQWRCKRYVRTCNHIFFVFLEFLYLLKHLIVIH